MRIRSVSLQMCVMTGPGANAINISGLLVQESRLLNPKKLDKFQKLNAIKFFQQSRLLFLEIQEHRLRSDKWFPNFTPNSYLGVQTPKQGIPKLGVNFFIASAPAQCFEFDVERSYEDLVIKTGTFCKRNCRPDILFMVGKQDRENWVTKHGNPEMKQFCNALLENGF